MDAPARLYLDSLMGELMVETGRLVDGLSWQAEI